MVRISRSDTGGWGKKADMGISQREKNEETHIFNRCSAVCGIGGLGISRCLCNNCLLVFLLKLCVSSFLQNGLSKWELVAHKAKITAVSLWLFIEMSLLFQTLTWWHVNLPSREFTRSV